MRWVLPVIVIIFMCAYSHASIFVPYPVPEDVPEIAPNMALEGKITGGELKYYKFNIEQNKRYFILVFPETIGSVRALILNSRGYTIAQNASPPAWTKMENGSFMALEVLPPDVPCGDAPITQIHAKGPLFILVRWGGYLPDNGSFIIELIEDQVPCKDGDYQYGGGRETWPFSGGITKPHPIPQGTIEITPGTALRGEITQEVRQKYYQFSIEENKRYFILTFTETIGDVETYLLTPGGLTITHNDNAPAWTQMGYGSFIAIEVLPKDVPLSLDSSITRVHADGNSLFFMVKSGNHPPDMGTFIVQVIESPVDTWPFSGIILPPAYVFNEGEEGEVNSEITINGEKYYYINPSTDESLPNIEIVLKGCAGAPAEWYLAIRTLRKGRFIQYYMDKNWRWVKFESIDDVKPFLTAVKELQPIIVSMPSVLLYPGEYELYFAADTCLNRLPDRIVTLSTAELLKEE
ncbi:MAG: hypothetical protein DRP81_04200 [Candidatus Omnitrophota bacterium]|nr:MAG: hypothetical protein DRP81_04200 [Candidatus Omnitrophota bacterium]